MMRTTGIFISGPQAPRGSELDCICGPKILFYTQTTINNHTNNTRTKECFTDFIVNVGLKPECNPDIEAKYPVKYTKY